MHADPQPEESSSSYSSTAPPTQTPQATTSLPRKKIKKHQHVATDEVEMLDPTLLPHTARQELAQQHRIARTMNDSLHLDQMKKWKKKKMH